MNLPDFKGINYKGLIVGLIVFTIVYSVFFFGYYISELLSEILLFTLTFNGFQTSIDALNSILTAIAALISLTFIFFDGVATYNLNFILGQNALPIENIWVAVRNVANSFFIVVLVYVAIRLIFYSLSNEGIIKEAKKTLLFVLAAAVFINFSLFFAKSVVEFTNLISLAIVESGIAQPGQEATTHETFRNIGHKIMATLGFANVYKLVQDGAQNDSEVQQEYQYNEFTANSRATKDAFRNSVFNVYLYGLFISLFLFLLAFVFLQITFVLLYRIFILFLLLVTSSVAFVSLMLSSFNKFFHLWLSQLLRAAFIFPIMIFLIYIIQLFLDEVSSGLTDGAGFLDNFLAFIQSGFTPPNGDFLQGPILVIILILLLYSVPYLANSLGGLAGEYGIKGYDKVKQWSLLGLGAGGRATLGYAADRYSRGDENSMFGRLGRSDIRYSTQAGLRGLAARTGLRIAENVADSKFSHKETHPERRDRLASETLDRAYRRHYNDTQMQDYLRSLLGVYRFLISSFCRTLCGILRTSLRGGSLAASSTSTAQFNSFAPQIGCVSSSALPRQENGRKCPVSTYLMVPQMRYILISR